MWVTPGILAGKGLSVNGYFCCKVVAEDLVLLCLPLCLRPLLNLHNWGTYLRKGTSFDSNRLWIELLRLFGEGHKRCNFGLNLLSFLDGIKVNILFNRVLLADGLVVWLRMYVVKAFFLWRIRFIRFYCRDWGRWLQRLQGLVGLLFLQVLHGRGVRWDLWLGFHKDPVVVHL